MSKSERSIGLWVLICVLWLVPAMPGAAEPTTPALARFKAAQWQGDIAALPRAPGAMARLAAPTLAAPLELWTRIAFQSYRDDNWEIYLSRGDGEQAQRLTSQPAADVYPRLNHGASQMVFASSRDGNYEIYRVNADGSGLTRLTDSPFTETRPVWSPDGQRILFEAGDSQSRNLHVMNADGSGITQLTTGGADVMGAWSPDGRQIVWVRALNQTYGALWVMNADGSGTRALSGPLPYLQNPIWSPDGTRIAFDCDWDADYLNEVMMINADGSNVQRVYDPSARGQLADGWAGSWSPDSRHLLCTLVQYVIAGQEVYIAAFNLERKEANGQNPDGSGDRLPGSGWDAMPDWQSADIWPPQVAIKPMSRFVRAPDGTFPVEWGGNDVGPAEIAAYEVHHRTGSGEWVDWQRQPYETGAHFHGQPGQTYAFRVRARDHAGNVSAWSEGPGNVVTPYAWAISGQVRDVRANPIPMARIVIDPAAFAGEFTDGQGRYAAYTAQQYQWLYRVSAERRGYLPSVPTDQPGQSDVQGFDLYLLLQPNRLQNGDFESGSLSGWQTLEATPPQGADTHHTGAYGALLGQVFSMNRTAMPEQNRWVLLGLDQQHTVHGAYVRWSATPRVAYVSKPPDGTWSAPTMLSSQQSDMVQLVVDASDTVHVLWSEMLSEEGYSLVHNARLPDGSWTGPSIGPLGPYPAPWTPQVAADSVGNLHLVWGDGMVLRHMILYHNGAWSAPTVLPGNPDLKYLSLSGVYVAAGDVVHVIASEERETPDYSGHYTLVHSRRGPGEAWSAPQPIATITGSRNVTSRSAVDDAGRLYLFVTVSKYDDPAPGWNYRTQLSRCDDGSNWSPLAPLPAWDNTILFAVAPDGQSGLHAFLQDTTTGECVYSASRDRGATWSARFPLVRDFFPQVALIDLVGNRAYLSAQNELGEIEGFAEKTTDSVLRQTVAVPTEMDAPTLSFLYQIARILGTSTEDRLEVNINGTPVWTTNAPTAGWTHAWVDLSAYRGQTIIIDFNLHNHTGGARSWAYLDDVSVSGWQPFPYDHAYLPLALKLRP